MSKNRMEAFSDGVIAIITIMVLEHSVALPRKRENSGRWDSDPQHLPWEGSTLPLSYGRIQFYLPAIL